MKINKITLFNYGPFCGEHTLDFTSTHYNGSLKRNIILIGGKNGSGKTSLFKAIQVCLYGQTALGMRASKTYYEKFLNDVIHQSNDRVIQSNESFIEVDFSFSVSGRKSNYCVKRSWMNKNNKIVEELFVSKDQRPLDETEQTHWQDFVKNMIPQGVLQLFFFDGERINSLTQEKDNIQLADSIQTLFGLDVVNQLKVDLRQYERRKLKTKAAGTLSKQIKNIEDQISEIENQVVLSKEEQARLQIKLDAINRDIEKEEKQIRSIGGGGLNRDELKASISRLEKDIEEKQARLRNLFQHILPLYYSKEYMKYALDRIALEQKIRKGIELTKELKGVWKKKISSIRPFLRNKGDSDKLLDILIGDNKTQTEKIVHNTIDETTIAEMKRCFKVDVVNEHKQAKSLVVELEKNESKLASLRKKLQQVPDDQLISKLVHRINELSQKKGKFENLIQQELQNEKKLVYQQSILTRDQDKLNIQLDELASHDRKLNLVSRTNRVLDIFERELIESQINELKENVLVSFNKLLRKGDILKSLDIDKRTFDVSLEDKLGYQLETNRLSEGEKQVYAISMLSGIAKTTNRPLPILFDTPLGRLDSEHRENIIHKYFPTASHQIIILSTDTEIDKQYFEDLKQYVSHSFLLDFDKKKRQSFIKKGYFWK